MRPQLIIAIHGIITDERASAWQQRFEAFIKERYVNVQNRTAIIDTLTWEYWEGPHPIISVFLLNPRQAQRLADEIIEGYLLGKENPPEISFVTHSNGADIARKTMAILDKRGFKAKAIVFIAGAIPSDVQSNGIAGLIQRGSLGRAYAYCSHDDIVLRDIPFVLLWPYGRLGSRGFTINGRCGNPSPSSDPGKMHTRWFTGYDHGTYFAPENETKTFELAVKDCCFTS